MKKLSILFVFVLVVSLPLAAAASGPRTTGFQIQNLGTAEASVTINYYATDGTLVCSDTVAIAIGSSKNYYQGPLSAGGNSCISDDSLYGPTWQGSVVIESTEPVAVITNIAESTNYAAGAYVGTPDTLVGDPLILPAIMGGTGFYGFTTDFAIQNAGASASTCTLYFVNGTTGATDKTVPLAAIPVGASYYREQETDDTDLTSNWLGVVVADCDQPMAGTINQKRLASAAGALLTYDAVASDKIPAGSDVSLPVIMWDYFTYWTGVQIVATAANTSGTIYFYDDTGTQVFSETFGPLGLYGSHTVLPSTYGGTFTGLTDELYSGNIVFSAGSGLAMVNQRDTAGAVGMTYGGVFADALSSNISIPFAAHNYFGVSTGFQVVNTGAAGNITVTFTPNPAYPGQNTPAPVVIALASGGAVPLQQFLSGGNDPLLTGCAHSSAAGGCGTRGDTNHWIGSITVVGDAGMALSAIVNERGFDLPAIGDVGMVYNAFNY